jgi:hypothetical protein
MSLVSSRLMSQNAKLSEDGFGQRTYTHDYLIEMSSDADGQYNVYTQMESGTPDPVPARWSNYNVLINGTAGDNTVFLQQREIKRKEDREDERNLWIVSCTWKPPDPGQDSTQPDENPLTRPIKYHLEWASFTRIIEKDINGDAVTNSAGDLFDPPVEIDDARPVLVAVKNMWPLENIIALSIQYKNAVNTDTFFDAPARTAKVESIQSGQLLYENGYDYYAVTFRVQFNQDTWDVELVDRGSQIMVRNVFDDPDKGFHKEWPRKLKYDGSGDVNNIASYSFAEPKEYLDLVNLEPDGTRRYETLPALFKSPAFRIYPEEAFSGLGIGGS